MSWGDIIGGVISVIGVGADIYSTVKGADAAEDAADAQAEQYKATAEANAVISRYDAGQERLLGVEQSYVGNQTVAKHRKNVEAFVSNQKARYGKSGVYVAGGTPLEVAAKTIKNASQDEYTIRNENRKAVQTHKILSDRYEMLAEKGLREGAAYANMALQAGSDQADAYWIRGAGSVINKTYQMGQNFDWWD